MRVDTKGTFCKLNIEVLIKLQEPNTLRNTNELNEAVLLLLVAAWPSWDDLWSIRNLFRQLIFSPI